MKLLLGILCAACCLAPAASIAKPTLSKTPTNSEKPVAMSALQQFNLGSEAMRKGCWAEAVKCFAAVSANFPATPLGNEAFFYAGVSNYYLGDYDLANGEFNSYLQAESNPAYFFEAIEYKFYIAEQFRRGAKRHVLGTKHLPKWASGYDLALEIYNEVTIAMPHQDLAAKAFYGKAKLHLQNQELRESIDAFQTLIKRFPKHELAIESYLCINKVYLEQARREFQNPDILARAEINLRKFEDQFPGEERLQQARNDLQVIKEFYAKGLYDTGRFYEKIRRPKAAAIYYQKAITDFPDTRIANICRSRLQLPAT